MRPARDPIVRPAASSALVGPRPRTTIAVVSALLGVLLVAAAAPAGAVADAARSASTPAVQLEVDRVAFSPNGDGVADAVVALVSTDVAGSLTLDVLDATGTVVRTLADADPIPAGETVLAWSGTDDLGAVVADGAYALRADVTDGTGASGSAETGVVVDTSAPKVRWRRIAPQPVERVRAHVRFAFEVTEAARGLIVVTDALGDAVHAGEWSTAGGVVRTSWNLRAPNGARVPPGGYVVTVVARDDAGNSGTGRDRAFRDLHPVPARVVTAVRGAGRRVALTFDDCVFGAAWGRILRVLERRDEPASFFCPGERVLAEPALARRTVRGGHAVGSHGWDHLDLADLGRDAIVARLRRDESAWWRTTGATAVPLFRPPYGSLDAEVRRAAGASGYAWIALWDVDPRDWELPGVREIAARVLEEVHPGSIVVLHVNRQTARALPAILDGLARRHLEPVTMLELLDRASELETGHVARRPV